MKPKGTYTQDQLRFIAKSMEELVAFNTHLGLRVETIEHGRCVLRIPWKEWLLGDPIRPALHGGVLSTIIDTAGGIACWTMLDEPHDRLSTVDLRVDYLEPAPPKDVVCEAHVVRVGNRVAVARMEVFPQSIFDPHTGHRNSPVATGQGVYNVLRGAAAGAARGLNGDSSRRPRSEADGDSKKKGIHRAD